MRIYDISMTIETKMPVYKNKEEKTPQIKTKTNGYVTESSLSFNLHTGTHIDAPLHMLSSGKDISNYPLENFLTHCKVLSFSSEKISRKDLENKDIKKGDFLLFKTKNSYFDDFIFDFAYLDEEGAAYLKEKEIKGVGIDALGIERNQKNHPTHKLLLGAGIIIIEGLRLKDVPEGEYFLIALPLKIKDVEAAPTRAILVEKGG